MNYPDRDIDPVLYQELEILETALSLTIEAVRLFRERRKPPFQVLQLPEATKDHRRVGNASKR